MQNIKYKIIITVAFFLILPNISEAASKFWIGGTGNYSDATHWSTSSGGANNTTKAVSGDTATFDGSSGGGTVTFDEAVVATSITMGAFTGTINTNGQDVTVGTFSITGTATRTLTLGASTITVTSSGTAWNGSTVTGLTMNEGTSHIILTTGNFFGGGVDYNNVTLQGASATASSGLVQGTLTITGGGAMVLGTAITMVNLTVTGTAAKTDNISFGNNKTISGTLTINGDSSINRILVKGNVLGTATTITAATVSVTNVDFMDITGAGAGNWNLSAISGFSGDALGNSGITFTTATTTYWIGGTGNWADTAEWSWGSGLAGSTTRVPLPQDNIVFDNNSFNGASQTVSSNMARLGHNINWSAYSEAQTPIWSTAAGSNTIYGSLTLVSGMTTSSTGGTVFAGRDTQTLTSAGVTFNQGVTFSGPGGTYTFQDALITATQFRVTAGTVTAVSTDITAGTLVFDSLASVIANMGSGTWTGTGTAGVWTAGANAVINADTSTIVVSNTTATPKTFTGGAKTYNNVTITGDDVTIASNNTFNVLALNNPTEAEGTIIGTGSTQTISSLTTTASVGNIVLLSGVAGGGAETLSDSSGTNCIDFVTITNITVSGGASWYAGTYASADGGGNSGWSFSACPGGAVTPPTHKTLLQRFKMLIFGKMIIR